MTLDCVVSVCAACEAQELVDNNNDDAVLAKRRQRVRAGQLPPDRLV